MASRPLVTETESEAGEWEDLPARRQVFKEIPPVRLTLFKSGRSQRGTPPGARLLLRKDIVEQLKLKTHRVLVRVGKGARAHQLAVVPQADGPHECLPITNPRVAELTGNTYRVSFPTPEGWKQVAPFAPEERSYKIEHRNGNPYLVVDLPQQLWRGPALRSGVR